MATIMWLRLGLQLEKSAEIIERLKKGVNQMTTKSKIPKFARYEEEAEFWDIHEFTDFQDETTPVKVEVSPNLSKVVPVRLAPDALTLLETEAKRMGIGTSTLIRMWVLERLQGLASSHSHL